MRFLNSNTLKNVLITVAQCARQKTQVHWSTLGLSSPLYYESVHVALTHNFNMKEHGVDLDAMYKEEDGLLIFNERSDNPKDEELLNRIQIAAAWYRKNKKQQSERELTKYSTSALENELQRRKNAVELKQAAIALECTIAELPDKLSHLQGLLKVKI